MDSASPLTAKAIRAITEFMRVEHAVVARTEIGLALGNVTNPASVAVKTGQLYRAGAFSHVIVSGGVRPLGTAPFQSMVDREQLDLWRREYDLPDLKRGDTEAAYMRRVLVTRFDVPSRNIIVEDRSTDTGKNFVYAKELGLGAHQTISVVNIAPTTRRAYMTARKHLGDAPVIVAHGVFPVLGVDWSNWARHEGMRATMLAEYGKIYATQPRLAAYVRQDYCVPVDLREEYKRVALLVSRPSGGTTTFVAMRAAAGGKVDQDVQAIDPAVRAQLRRGGAWTPTCAAGIVPKGV